MASVGGEVRRLAPGVWIAMAIAEVVSTWFSNYVVFRSDAVVAVVRGTDGLVCATLIASTLENLVIVVGILVAWGGAGRAELGVRVRDLPRAIGVTLAVWLALNGAALVYDLATDTPVQLAAEWHAPSWLAGEWLGQILGNALREEILWRAVLVTQLALWLARDAQHMSRRRLMILIVISQALFMLSHIPNRLAMHLWPSALYAVGDLAQLWGMGIVFTAIWLRTRNLLVSVGIHAMVNVSGHLVAAPGWLIDGVMIAAMVALLVKPPRGKQRCLVVHEAQCARNDFARRMYQGGCEGDCPCRSLRFGVRGSRSSVVVARRRRGCRCLPPSWPGVTARARCRCT